MTSNREKLNKLFRNCNDVRRASLLSFQINMCNCYLQHEVRRLQGILGAMCILNVGKYKGRTFSYVKNADIGYCEWVMNLYNPTIQLKLFQEWLLSTASIICPKNLEDFFTPVRPRLRYELDLIGLF